jgi:5'-3' exonuclease
MGIPSYFAYVLRNHGRIIRRLETIRCNLLLVDANSLIYDAYHEHGTDHLLENVLQKVLDLKKKLRARKTYVAFDGVVPLAKMAQQKQRRYKSWLTKQLFPQEAGWNTNAITPGTTFMAELDAYLTERFKPHKDIVYSGPHEVGEGEQKMFNYLKHFPTPNTVVYGLDADLIMLSLLNVANVADLYLYRETKHFAYMKNIDPKSDYVFHVDSMAKEIHHQLVGANVKASVSNYCFLCFLCGNDFMPHCPAVNLRNNGISFLLSLYKEKLPGVNLVQGGRIQWRNVQQLFRALAEVEPQMVQDNIRWKLKLRKPENQTPDDALNRMVLQHPREQFLLEHYDKYYSFIIGQGNHRPACKAYLQMLEWTWAYYHGVCKDFYLAYPFSLAPLFSSLVDHMPVHQEEELVPFRWSPPPSPLTQLFYVLPYSDFATLMPNNSIVPKVCNAFPTLCLEQFPLHFDFCKFFYEGHADFPRVDLLELDAFVKQTLVP